MRGAADDAASRWSSSKIKSNRSSSIANDKHLSKNYAATAIGYRIINGSTYNECAPSIGTSTRC